MDVIHQNFSSFDKENELIQALGTLTQENVEFVYQRVDNNKNSLLFYAVQKGFNQVAQQILESPTNYRVDGQHGSTPLHFAPNSSEYVLRLLLNKHSDLFDICDNKGYNVLHQWAELQNTWQFDMLRGAEFEGQIRSKLKELFKRKNETEFKDYPIHIAALNGNLECVKFIVNDVYDEIEGETPPWRVQNNYEHTPLHRAIYVEKNEIALYLLQKDPTLSQIHDNGGQSPFQLTVLRGSRCEHVVREIMRIREPDFRDLRSNNGTTVLHWLYGCTEELGMELLKKYWWLISMTDENGKTALQYAIENNSPWLVRMLRYPSLIIEKEYFDWNIEFTAELSWVLLAFTKSCKDLPKICREKRDTPLHHIKFDTYTEYVDFLNIPSVAELKNITDSEGATPLHRAIERQDIDMVQALLTDVSVDRYIKNGNGRTAMELLSKQCKTNDDWEIMCNHIRVNPHLKTSYIRPETNLDQIRTSLSVVAALLATITFAAGFTLPGGLDDKTGDAKLPRRAAFIVFLLADALAMCTSMLVLFCLIWSMVSNHNMSRVLVEYSVYTLTYISLPSTTVAFMAGIYTVIKHTFFGVIIVFFITSSLIIIIAYKRILFFIIAKLVPAINQGTSPQGRQRTSTCPEFRIFMGLRSHQNED